MRQAALLSALFLSSLGCFAQGLTGTWAWGKESASGGTLKIIDNHGHLSFQLTCYRMRSSQFVGDISGEVEIQNNKGEFISPDLPDCEIRFTVKKGKIVLLQTGKGDCEFGTGVQADGTYLRKSKDRPTFD